MLSSYVQIQQETTNAFGPSAISPEREKSEENCKYTHQNKEHLTWDKTVRESLPCTPSPNTHRGDTSTGAMQRKSPPGRKRVNRRDSFTSRA